jgi:hypothetical protein
VVQRCGETPTWQIFSGQAYFEHHRPCDASALISRPCKTVVARMDTGFEGFHRHRELSGFVEEDIRI